MWTPEVGWVQVRGWGTAEGIPTGEGGKEWYVYRFSKSFETNRSRPQSWLYTCICVTLGKSLALSEPQILIF